VRRLLKAHGRLVPGGGASSRGAPGGLGPLPGGALPGLSHGRADPPEGAGPPAPGAPFPPISPIQRRRSAMTPSRIRGRRPPADPDRSAAPDTEHPAPGPGTRGTAGSGRRSSVAIGTPGSGSSPSPSPRPSTRSTRGDHPLREPARLRHVRSRGGASRAPERLRLPGPGGAGPGTGEHGAAGRGEKESGTEYLFRRADGSRFPAILHAVPVPDGQGGLRFGA
jgi:hypothetical protein